MVKVLFMVFWIGLALRVGDGPETRRWDSMQADEGSGTNDQQNVRSGKGSKENNEHPPSSRLVCG
jgi:hypothetical protein